MYAIQLTKIDYQAHTESTMLARARYKTLKNAERAASRLCCVVKPDGKTAASETRAIVVPVDGNL